MIAASKAYSNATKMVIEEIVSLGGSPPDSSQNSPKDRFTSALKQLRIQVSQQPIVSDLPEEGGFDWRLLTTEADATRALAIVQSIPKSSLDDFTPNQIFHALASAAEFLSSEAGPVDIECIVYLKTALKILFEQSEEFGRFNVGRNRHWPRLWQWLREYAEETVYDEGTGLKVMNASRTGYVAEFPRDPAALLVRIEKDWL